ncbi:MAG: polyprenyl synthetase family protein [Magnetococcales bacterium]|nr:polyprenyl synthetase family protein [Magnetococcales bacterium]NGZ07491.1 polyprenyl synthetase family protein [Magnetococcales bacterium]
MKPQSNLPPVLKRLGELIGPDLERTNAIILEQLNSQVELIPKMGAHIIESGGKRLRPVLTLLSARLFGYTGQNDALLAAVIEFIHTATLLHDDVVDKSNTRRGRATANSVWGSKAPVLVGDYLFSRSFQILVAHGDLKVLQIVADACAVISEGEVMQLVATNDLSTSEEHYLEVVQRKTATLFAAAAEIGAVLNQRPTEEVRALARYGLLLGTAYQVVDDALDYSATNEVLGKSVGDDFHEGKITLPVIHAYRHGNPEERAFWSACLERKEFPDKALSHAIQLIRARGSLDYAMQRATTFAAEAKEQLATLPATPEREAMAMLADFSVERSY